MHFEDPCSGLRQRMLRQWQVLLAEHSQLCPTLCKVDDYLSYTSGHPEVYERSPPGGVGTDRMRTEVPMQHVASQERYTRPETAARPGGRQVPAVLRVPAVLGA